MSDPNWPGGSSPTRETMAAPWTRRATSRPIRVGGLPSLPTTTTYTVSLLPYGQPGAPSQPLYPYGQPGMYPTMPPYPAESGQPATVDPSQPLYPYPYGQPGAPSTPLYPYGQPGAPSTPLYPYGGYGPPSQGFPAADSRTQEIASWTDHWSHHWRARPGPDRRRRRRRRQPISGAGQRRATVLHRARGAGLCGRVRIAFISAAGAVYSGCIYHRLADT